MDREKQIEQMAKVIARRSKSFRDPNVAFMRTAKKTAESLYNADYRKQSEVAKEIFEEIEKLKYTKYDWNDYVEWDAIAELKKKYIGE